MKFLPYRFPQSAIRELTQSIFSELTDDSIVELKIKMKDTDVNLREFGNFILFIDRLYGRMYEGGIYKYSHNRSLQIVFSEIKAGSLEATISETVPKLDAEKIAIIWLFLKYLPLTIRSLSGAYRDFEDARLIRLQRKQIKEKLKQDLHSSNKCNSYL